MKHKNYFNYAAVFLSIFLTGIFEQALAVSNTDSEKINFIASSPIVGGLDEAEALTVELAPGMASKPHRHNAQVFVYMLEGEAVMQVKGGQKVTLKPGDTFYENPDDIHNITQNASKSKPARFLVYIIKKKGAPALVPLNE